MRKLKMTRILADVDIWSTFRLYLYIYWLWWNLNYFSLFFFSLRSDLKNIISVERGSRYWRYNIENALKNKKNIIKNKTLSFTWMNSPQLTSFFVLQIQEPRTYPSFEGEVETSPDRPDEYGGPIVLNDPVQSSRLYQCPHCEYKSNVLINVKQHIKFKHTGERPFACLICFKRFTTKQNLQVHTRIHTGEKPYRCSVCLKDFNHKSNYDKHKKYVHSEFKL